MREEKKDVLSRIDKLIKELEGESIDSPRQIAGELKDIKAEIEEGLEE